MQQARYALSQRLIHWLIAITVIGVLIAGLIIGTLGFKGSVEMFGKATTNALYKYHKSFGVVLLGLMSLRLILRIVHGRPAHEASLPMLNRIASEAVHGTLYILLLVMPVVGWMATASGGFPVEFFGWVLPGLMPKDPELSKWLYGVHGWLGYAILGFAGVHIAAAIMHWRMLKDGVMRRMSLP